MTRLTFLPPIAAPFVSVAAGCYLPWSVNQMLGFPLRSPGETCPTTPCRSHSLLEADAAGLWFLIAFKRRFASYAAKLTPSLQQALMTPKKRWRGGRLPDLSATTTSAAASSSSEATPSGSATIRDGRS